MNRKLVFCLSLIAAILIVGCSGQPAATTNNTSSSSSSTPADGAKAYFNAALLGQGDAASLVCSTMPAETKAGMQAAMDTAKNAYTSSGATVDLSELTFTTQNESGDTADVVVAGKLKITVSGQTTENDYPSSTIKMKNENGWKVCG